MAIVTNPKCANCGSEIVPGLSCPGCPDIIEKMITCIESKAEVIRQARSGSVELCFSWQKDDIKIHINAEF